MEGTTNMLTKDAGTKLSIAEIFIAHVLWGNPGMTHITPDGQKLYFLDERKLICVEAEDKPFDRMSRDEINDIVLNRILNRMNSAN